MAESIKKQTVNGVFWSASERFSVQSIQFVLQIIMARILTPSETGLVGMLAIFIAISQSIVDCGFSTALIQKKNRTETDFSTVFYFNIAIGLILYFALYFSSPFIAHFYQKPILEDLTKVISLNIFIQSLTVVQRAKLIIAVNFKTQAKAAIIAVLISGPIGIWMAYNGYSVWAIAIQTVINGLVNMILLWIYSKWKPLAIFSWISFRQLFSFGSKLLVSGLLDTIYNNLYTVIIGKKFSTQDLGDFLRANQFAQYPAFNISSIISRVLLPILSNIQNDQERLRIVYLKYLKMSAFIVFPLMIGLVVLADPLIYTVLTEKWSGAIPLLQILCFAYMWYPVHIISIILLQIKGRPDLALRLEIIKKILGIVVLLITVFQGITVMCFGMVFIWMAGLIINAYYSKKIIQIGLLKQMKSLYPILLNTLSMGGVVWLLTSQLDNNVLKLSVGIVGGIIYYFTVAYINKSEEFKDITSLVKKINK